MGLSLHLTLLLLAASVTNIVSYTPIGCQGFLDIAFIMDQSESIRESSPVNKPDQNWDIFKRFVQDVITGLPVSQGETKTALIKYSSAAEVVWDFNTYTAVGDIYQAIRNLNHDGGNTNTAAALEMAREEVFIEAKGDRGPAKNIVILMTDGLSTINSYLVGQEANRILTESKAEIYVIAIGKYIDQDELRKITQDFSKNIIQIEEFNQLSYIQRLLLHRVCSLPDPDPDFTPPPGCNQVIDLALIVDNSGSVKHDYDELKQFLANVVDQFKVGADKNRVAVVRFSDIAQLEFRLNEFYNMDDIKDTILKMPFRDLDTNTSGGIRETVKNVFSGSPGDRPRVCNVALLITDGVSTVEVNNTLPDAAKAKQQNIQFFVVGVTNKINRKELQTIASYPVEDHFFDSTAVRYLNALIYRLVTAICANPC